MHRPLSIALSLLLLASVAVPVHAVEPLDTFSIKLGGYASRFDTQLSVDGGNLEGTEIDLDRDLNLDQDSTIGLVGISWRPFEHHEFGLNYYQDDVSATKVLQRDIVFDGVTYETDTTVRAERNLDTYEAYYVWWAASHENWALGPRLGLVWYNLDFGIDLTVDANGNPVGSGAGFDRDANGDVPAPAIGGGWRWTPADDWRISADLGYFSADISDVDANVTYARAGVEWFPWDNWGFWVDVTANRIDADLKKDDFRGNFDFREEGVRVGVAYRF
ncbi:porin family protein [Lysobacter aestuarii]|uniref:Porin family protein n=2 Tax=Marilutibacter aestuarii TaxID=1706195 RepID=A0A508ANF9_9GAMM|nr:porin family protein [Lysobacter aestuarii]